MTAEADIVRGTSRLGTILGLTTVTIGILVGVRLVMSGWAMIVLGVVGEAVASSPERPAAVS